MARGSVTPDLQLAINRELARMIIADRTFTEFLVLTEQVVIAYGDWPDQQ